MSERRRQIPKPGPAQACKGLYGSQQLLGDENSISPIIFLAGNTYWPQGNETGILDSFCIMRYFPTSCIFVDISARHWRHLKTTYSMASRRRMTRALCPGMYNGVLFSSVVRAIRRDSVREQQCMIFPTWSRVSQRGLLHTCDRAAGMGTLWHNGPEVGQLYDPSTAGIADADSQAGESCPSRFVRVDDTDKAITSHGVDDITCFASNPLKFEACQLS